MTELVPPAPHLPEPLFRPRYEHASAGLPQRTECRSLKVPRSFYDQLTALARARNATTFHVILAALYTYFLRTVGREELVAGVPAVSRTNATQKETADLTIGAVPFSFGTNLSFLELLREISRVLQDDLSHPRFSLSDLRDEREQQLFDVLVCDERFDPDTVFGAEPDTYRPMPLAVFIRESADADVNLDFVFNSAYFEREEIDAIQRRVLRVLRTVVRDVEINLEQIPLVTSEDIALLERWNATTTAYPLDQCVHTLFDAKARERGQACALVSGQQRWTYDELATRARTLSAWLESKGVAPGDKVALSLPKEPDLIAAMLAIIRIGAAYVPIALDCPRDRRAFIAQDAGIRWALTRSEYSEELETANVVPLLLDECPSAGVEGVEARGELRAKHPSFSSETTAYVIYTSGTTGLPKGVSNSHRNVINFAMWCRDADFFGSGDAITQFAPYTFDASVGEIFGGLLAGVELHLLAEELIQDPRALEGYLIEHHIRFAAFPPPYLQQLDPERVPKGMTILSGGSEPTLDLVERWGAKCRYFNAYGPTETTIVSAAWKYDPAEVKSGRVPVGRPISNTQVYILDTHLQPVPIGVTGEIYIGGAGVARGYLNQPELTAQRFLKDPFDPDPAARLYKTGDLGRWQTNGTIEFLGRNDQQVKLRGFRIELGEIEAALARHHHVQDAVVITREDVPGNKQLVAYTTRRDKSDPSVEALRAHLRLTLPDYMIPHAFVTLDRLPLTANGKVDRRALPAPGIDAYAARHYEAPQDEVEQRLATMWQELLGVERVGRGDSFFDLGGHSLLVVKAVAGINESFGSALSAPDMYGSPTLRDLAARIRDGKSEDQFVDLSKEAALGDEITARPGVHRRPAQAVMLTGGTGFVGRFLLTQLLEHTDATIYCLVRGKSQGEAVSRLRTTLTEWDLWRDEYESRMVGVPADLRAPRLGVNADTWQLLSQEVDTIYHCATSMNYLESYAMARPANVDSARQLLKLATQGSPKLINYLSTLDVFTSIGTGMARVVNEATPIDHERHPAADGYAASKWVAEKIFMNAVARGIPCNIFRLGLVWPDTRHGRYDDLQQEYRIFKSCLLCGFGIRNYRYDVAPIPVDQVARSVVGLADRHADGGGLFHICSSGRLERVFERCNEVAGTSLQLLSHYDWIREIKRLHEAGRSLPIVPLVEFAFSMDEETFAEHLRGLAAANVQVDCTQTNSALERAGIVVPPPGDALISSCVAGLLSRDAQLRAHPLAQ